MRFALSLFVAALGFFTTETATPPNPQQPLEVRIEIAPSIYDSLQLLKRPTPNTYTCQAIVLDEPHHGIGSARLIAEPGRRETVKRSERDIEVEFTVLIAPSGDRADTKVTVRRAGMVVMRQSSTVRLMNIAAKKYVPLQ
jgi:hypothetical protein